MSGKTYEMFWDCKFCGETKLLAKTHKHCPVCGAPQDPATRYYPSDDEKVAVEDHQFVGADKICPACQTPNSAANEYCMECGAPLSAAAQAATLEAQTRAEGEKFTSSGSRDVVKERFDAEMRRVGVQPSAGKSTRSNRLGVILIVLLVIGAVAAILALTVKRETTVVVTGHSWERVINIEEYSAVRDGSWQESVPIGAYNRTCYEKQRSTRRIPDGETCQTRRVDQGDGTFREERVCRPKYREEPVYDTWCDYTINRWVYDHSETASDDTLSEPYWPQVNFSCSGEQLGCQREGGREETYLLHLVGDEGRTYECPVPFEQWQSATIESVWSIEVRVVDPNAADCDTLQPASAG